MEKNKNKPYMALKGKIVEEGHTYKSLAAAIGRTPKFISNRVSGKVDFSMDDLGVIASALNIEPLEMCKYFFPTAYKAGKGNVVYEGSCRQQAAPA
ncbi:MAG: DUF739 family protein [Dehalobacter sp.]|nr:DUF739 family protein [Dehalobacter sp.]